LRATQILTGRFLLQEGSKGPNLLREFLLADLNSQSMHAIGQTDEEFCPIGKDDRIENSRSP